MLEAFRLRNTEHRPYLAVWKERPIFIRRDYPGSTLQRLRTQDLLGQQLFDIAWNQDHTRRTGTALRPTAGAALAERHVKTVNRLSLALWLGRHYDLPGLESFLDWFDMQYPLAGTDLDDFYTRSLPAYASDYQDPDGPSWAADQPTSNEELIDRLDPADIADLFDPPLPPVDDSQSAAASSVSDSVTDPNLLFRIYIPSERLYAAEAGRLLDLFHDWLVAIRGRGIRRSGYQTASGEMYEFYADATVVGTDLQQQFFSFSSFLSLCADSPSAAVDFLAVANLGSVVSSDLVNRFGREVRRLKVDLLHDRERRVLSLRQSLEQELVENNVDLRLAPSNQLSALVESLIPGSSAPESFALLAGPQTATSTGPITVNINPQIISALESTIVQNSKASLISARRPRRFCSLIDRFGGDDRYLWRSAVHEIEDVDAPPANRSAARRRLTKFLGQLAGTVQEVGLDLLEKYLESRLFR